MSISSCVREKKPCKIAYFQAPKLTYIHHTVTPKFLLERFPRVQGLSAVHPLNKLRK